MLLGEGSNAEQMRDSGKIITTARQDKLDKLSAEGINVAFFRQFNTLRPWTSSTLHAFGNMQLFFHHWSADGVWHWRTATVTDGSRELLTSR
jgi:hypothetical protein